MVVYTGTYTIYYGLPKTPCWPEVPDVATKADQKNRGNDASPFPPLILVTIMNRISVLCSTFRCLEERAHSDFYLLKKMSVNCII